MKNWSMDLLKYRPFPELAGALRARQAVVIERWQQVVTEVLPAANELTLAQIRDSLPETLAMMADALEADEPKPTKDLMDFAGAHGETRFDQNFALGELMIEYGLLRPILIGEAAQHLNRVVTIEETQALNLAIDVACRRGVITYVNQQKAEIQSLVEAQSKYLSFLSHDLRGNLNGVLLMIEVLRRDLASEPRFAESLDDLEIMRRSIHETVGTMDRFLHAERFRKGKVQVRSGPVNMQALVAEVIGQFSYQAKEKKLELKSDVGPATDIVTDRELLLIILQNLVGNAIKYSKRGEVLVAATKPDDMTCACRLSVIDHGPGMKPEAVAKLFDPFTRGDTHGESGSGLGLTIARQAADLLGARLWVESEDGDGSKFHLDLPHEPPGHPANPA
jgi:signal transduction histidine kinase